MTPSPTLLLVVALFWTLPASVAALLYRRNGSSIEQTMKSVKQTLTQVQDRLLPETT